MSSLTSRYSHVRRLECAPEVEEAEVYGLVNDFLDWKLVEMDANTVDLLIARAVDGQFKEIVLLRGRVASAWLRRQAPT